MTATHRTCDNPSSERRQKLAGTTGLRRALAAITVANLGLLLVWSVVVPTFRAPDEHVHHDFLRHLTTTWAYPEYDELDVSRRTLDALGVSPAFPAHHAPVAADDAAHRPDRPGWSDLGPDVRNGPANQMPQHPPLYYEATAALLRVLDGDGTAPLDRAVWQLRVLNALVMATLPLFAADIARRFTTSAPVVVAAAAGVLAIPQLTHIGATVSNDPWMIVLSTAALAGAARLATGDRRWGTAIATGALAGLALLTKGFAIPIVPAVALACVLPLLPRFRRPAMSADHWPTIDTSISHTGGDGSQDARNGDGDGDRDRPARHDQPTGAGGAAAGHSASHLQSPTGDLAATGSVLDRSGGEARPVEQAATSDELSRAAGELERAELSHEHDPARRPPLESAGGVTARAVAVAALALAIGGWWWIRNVVAYGTPQPGVRLRDRVPGVEHDIVRFAGDFGERIVTSFWGSFGWFESRLPMAVSIAMTALVVVAAAAACWRRLPRLVLLLPVATAGGMVLSSGWGAFKKTGVSYATQGRYLFAGAAALAVLVALGVARLSRQGSWWQPAATLVVALALQAMGLWIAVGRYWAGDGIDERLRSMAAFAPVPGLVTASLFVLAAAGTAAALVVLASAARRPRP